jgi:O-antigen ligase
MKKIFYWSILLFSFLIPISSLISVRILILVLFLALISESPKINFKGIVRKTWDIILYLLILIIGLTYTQDIDTGLRVLETSFSLLALMIIANRFENFGHDFFHKVLVSFIAGLLVTCLICIVNAFLNFLATGDIQFFFYYKLTEVVNLHPTYLAYYLIASITYCIFLIYNEIEKKRKAVLVVIALLFFAILMLTGGRTAYVSLLLVFSFFILKFILEESNSGKKVAFILVVILFFSLFGVNRISYFNNELEITNDYWERFGLWESALKANSNGMLGVGTGDYKMVLNQYYLSHGLAKFASDSYNSHNQFIQIYFSNGVVGLLALIILIARSLYLSVRSRNALGILLIFPFVIYGVTEVFLGRYQGVVFFALLHQIVLHQYYSSQQLLTLTAD